MSVDAYFDAVRRSLGLDVEDEILVRTAAPRLLDAIEGWVDRFQARLLKDPVASALLPDAATAQRLRRGVTSWFQEVLSPPYDAAYARAHAEVGRTHVRVGTPPHLIVTSMTGVRRDVRATVRERFAADPVRAERTEGALEKVLDLELALMLGAHRNHARELAQRTDRGVYSRRAEARAARARTDAAVAAACYLALLKRARDPESAERWSARLARALDAVVRSPEHALAAERAVAEAPRRIGLADVVARALEQVSVPARTEVVVVLDPPDPTVFAHATPLRLAVEEMVQNAVNRDPAGSVRLAATALADGGLLVEVSDGGARWPEDARDVEDAVASTGGVPLAFGELVTELHGGTLELVRPPGSGGGIRLRLRAARLEEDAS